MFKTWLPTAALLLIMTFSANAQRTSLGFTVGSNYSTVSSDLFDQKSGRVGLAAGVSIRIGLTDQLDFNSDLSFVQKGTTAETAYFIPEQKADIRPYKYNYNAYETAVTLGWQLATLPIRVHGGGFVATHAHNLEPAYNYQMVGDINDYNNAIPADELIDSFSGVDFGPVIGLTVGNDRICANLRYFIGAKNMYKNLDFLPEGHKIKSSSIRLSVGYYLR